MISDINANAVIIEVGKIPYGTIQHKTLNREKIRVIMSIPEEDLRKALAGILLKDDNDDEGVVDGIDGDIVSYLAGMLHEGQSGSY